jgi:hypothetical protein
MAQKNKVTPIVFKGIGDFDGREFTLEFNRKTVMKAEKAGLNLQEIDSKPMTMVGIMFWAAFLYHHPWISQEQTDKILDEQFGGVEGLGTIENDEGENLVTHLGRLYSEPFSTLIPSDEEGIVNPPKVAVKF